MTSQLLKPVGRPCPVCRHNQAELLYAQQFPLPARHPGSSGYELVCCAGCGFVYADTSATRADCDPFYSDLSKYGDDLGDSEGGSTPWDEQRLAATAQYIACHLLKLDARILDIGCANGGMLRHLQSLGYRNLVGIDPSPACVANTIELGIGAYRGGFSGADEPLGRFDCVIVSHVLEQVPDLDEAVQFLMDRLVDDGALYAEVADATRYGQFLVVPFQDFSAEQINHFSPDHLASLLESSGFGRIDLARKTIFSSADALYPATFGVWRPPCPQVQVNRHQAPRRSDCLRQSIVDYIEQSNRMMREMAARIDAGLGRDRRAIVWGTSESAMKLLVDTLLCDVEIVAIVSGNPSSWGRAIRGVTVVSPEKLLTMPGDVPILISPTRHEKAIASRIRNEIGAGNPLILLSDDSGLGTDAREAA